MIKASELRIGNWLMNNINGQYFPVTSIEFEWFYNIRYESISHLEKDCDPVPLTPEILEKFGFKETAYDGQYALNERAVFKIEINKIGLVSYRIGDIIFSNCHYLHQLQNLYFALTGQELTVNL